MRFGRWLASAVSLLAAFVLSPVATASCGAAFCTLNTQWETQGVWTEPGMRFDLRFEYIDQDQPRAGRDEIEVGEIPRHHDEVRTINRNWIATFDYGTSGRLGYSLQIPFIDRAHEHVHNHQGAALPQAWSFGEVGDVRLLARYRLSGEGPATGLLAGLKLPTGSTDERNADGDLAERSLQPGTGTTDGILGLYHNRALLIGEQPVTLFLQGQAQVPFGEDDGYRPGNQYSVDVGMSTPLTTNLSGLLQANLQVKTRDKGEAAEPEDTGGSFVWLSPGLSYALADAARVYGFVQLPLYQRVNGVQLTADWTAAIGIGWRF